MTSTPSTRRDRRLRRRQATRRRQAALVGCLLTVGTATALASAALFTDSVTVPAAATVGSGAVTLGLSPTSQTYTFSLAPGESFTTPITVTNSGSLPLRYAVRGTSDATDANFIAARLRFTAKTGVVTCTTAGFTGSGTLTAGPVQAASTTCANVVGNPTQGAHAGDRVLAPATSETLCLQITLPADQRGNIGGRTTTITYTFAAEQTANNP